MLTILDRSTQNIIDATPTTPHNLPESPISEQKRSPNLPSDQLTAPQRVAVAALISGRTFSSAAIIAGVDRRTLYEWRKQPAFAALLNEMSREALEATATRARNLMLKATRTLAESLKGRSQFDWAMRMVNSRRLSELGASLPADLSATDDGSPASPAANGG